MISFNLPRTLRDEEEGIDTPFVRQGPELVHWPSFQPGIVADFARFVRRLSPRPYHCVPPHPAPLRTIGPLRWPLCRERIRGLEELVERQREWPHEAEARFALVVRALPGPAVPRRS